MPRPKDYERRADRRSAQVFVIACEGEKTETLYFEHFTQGLRRVRVVPLATGKDGLSSPAHLLERLSQKIGEFPDAQAWLVFDTDHHFADNNRRGTQTVFDKARQKNFQIAVSNPCIELWFLLHLEDVAAPCDETHCTARLKELLSGYNHDRYRPEELRSGLADAIERARTLDVTPDTQSPQNPGSRVYRLMEALRAAITANGGPAPF